MNINEFKKHLNNVHGSLNYIDATNQLNHTLYEGCDSSKNSKSSTKEPTTEAGKSLKPHPSKPEKTKKVTIEYMDSYFGDTLNENTSDEDIMEAILDLNITCDAVNEYFEFDEESEIEFDEDITSDFITSYFGDSLNEDTSDEDILEAIENLNETCECVNEFFEIDEGFFSKVGKGAIGGLAAYGAYKAGKYLYGKHKSRSARLKSNERDATKHRSNVAIHQNQTAKGNRLKYVSKRDETNKAGGYTPATAAEKKKFKPNTIRSITPREGRRPLKIRKIEKSEVGSSAGRAAQQKGPLPKPK